MQPSPDALIIGGGVAGLTCAIELHKAGRAPLILEASDRVGGRVRTDIVDGFRLDRGFQVFLTAYPEAQRYLDYDKLALGYFRPGALIRKNGKFNLLADPIREPQHAVTALRAPIGTFADKLRVGLMRLQLASRSLETIAQAEETTTHSALKKRGLSDDIVEGFFRPFLSGIFLEHELATTSRMFEFVFKMFTVGKAALPANGIGEIPAQLAAQLPSETVLTQQRVRSVRGREVTTETEETYKAPHVILAADLNTATALDPSIRGRRWNSTACLYFAADKPPLAEPLLVLNGEDDGPANTVVALEQVAPGYAPPGASLISCSTVGVPDLDDHQLWDATQSQLAAWFGPQASRWRRLQLQRIPNALPRQAVGDEIMVRDARTHVCGDHTVSSSLNGAMRSGRETAHKLLESSR